MIRKQERPGSSSGGPTVSQVGVRPPAAPTCGWGSEAWQGHLHWLGCWTSVSAFLPQECGSRIEGMDLGEGRRERGQREQALSKAMGVGALAPQKWAGEGLWKAKALSRPLPPVQLLEPSWASQAGSEADAPRPVTPSTYAFLIDHFGHQTSPWVLKWASCMKVDNPGSS